MSEETTKQVRELVDNVYRSESRQVLATLIRLLGDFDTAEEALHDAFAVAVEQWTRDGVPAIRAPGSSPPAASRPLMGCAAVPGSTHR